MFPFIYNNTGITDDKVLHFLVGLGLTIILFLIGKYFFVKVKHNTNILTLKQILLIIVTIAIGKEFIDSFIPGRNVELLDFVFTVSGYFFFIFVIMFIQNIQKIIKLKI